MEKNEFKKLFPHLHLEMESGISKAEVEKGKEPQVSKKSRYMDNRKYAGYQPSAVDFIRRCLKTQEAEEIISFLEKKGDISREEAKTLLKQLKENGLRSFGPLKKPGYYEK